MPTPDELEELLTAMAESEPEPAQNASVEQETEFGTIAWYLNNR